MSGGNDPGAMRKLPEDFSPVEDARPDDEFDEYDDEDGYENEVVSWPSRWHHPPRPSDGPDERESLPELMGEVFGLADQVASRISPEAIEARLRRTIQEATPTIAALHLRTFNDARKVGEHFREGTPVIMNLTEMSSKDGRRLVDFSAGLVFGLRGNIERVTNRVFLLSTAEVEMTAADKARIGAGIIPDELPRGGTDAERAQAEARRVIRQEAPVIVTLHLRTFNDARRVGEHFREGTPVVMDLTELLEGDARRLVDFSAGLVFGLRGNIERLTNRVFVLCPASVEITAEDKARIVRRGFPEKA
jgi:cell division inhibitor SepF